MKAVAITLILLLAGQLSIAQHSSKQLGRYCLFTIPFGQDSVHFALVGGKQDLGKVKPILIFRQGSLPIPILSLDPKNGQPVLTELPQTFYAHQAEYHIIVIAKPGIPLVVADTYLDTLFSSNPNPAMYPAVYHQRNYLDYYVGQTNAVLSYVLRQPWADSGRVVIIGGSEGYQVGIKTAYTNRRVTHLIVFSGALEGRWQGQIRELRATAVNTPDQATAQAAIEQWQTEWRGSCQDSLSTQATVGDSNRSIYSFSQGHNLAYLLALSIPICVIYGTADARSHGNDILPVEFERRGKKNLTLKVYANHDHTLNKLTYDTNSRVTTKTYNGAEVQGNYFTWLAQH